MNPFECALVTVLIFGAALCAGLWFGNADREDDDERR